MALTGEQKNYLGKNLTSENMTDMNELLGEKKAGRGQMERFTGPKDLIAHMRGQGVTNDSNEIEVIANILGKIGCANIAYELRTGQKNPSSSVHVAAAAAATVNTTYQPQTAATAHASTVVVINQKKTLEERMADKKQQELEEMKAEFNKLKVKLRTYGCIGNGILENLTVDPETENEITELTDELHDALDDLKKWKEKLEKRAGETNKRILRARDFEREEKARQEEAERSKRRREREMEKQRVALTELEQLVIAKLNMYKRIKAAPTTRDPEYFETFMLSLCTEDEFLNKKEAVEVIFWQHLRL